jgi:hypothetical protein
MRQKQPMAILVFSVCLVCLVWSTWSVHAQPSATAAVTRQIYNEAHAVAEDGDSVTLVYPPVPGTERIYRNGVRLTPGFDFIGDGGVLTFLGSGLVSGDSVLADYEMQ